MTKSEDSLQKSSLETSTETDSADISLDDSSSSGLRNRGNAESFVDAQITNDPSEIIGQKSEKSSKKSSPAINIENAQTSILHDDSSRDRDSETICAKLSIHSGPDINEQIKSVDVTNNRQESVILGQQSEESYDISKAESFIDSSSHLKEPESAESIKSIDVAISKDISDNITESAHTDEGSQPNEKAGIISDSPDSSGVNNRGQGDNTLLIQNLVFKSLLFR